MIRIRAVALVWVLLLASGSAGAARADGPAPAAVTAIEWAPSLVGAFDAAKKAGKPLFIAINADRVDGQFARDEPAAKELREHTYVDASVVTKSREFVCVRIRPDGTSVDFAELRVRLGIQGDIVSPQHIFVHADGALIDRKEYWKHGPGAASIEALLAMMDAALAAHRAKAGLDAKGGAGSSDEQRWTWITERLEKIRPGAPDSVARAAAIQELVKADKDGDCVTPLVSFLSGPDKELDTTIAIVRGLGKPGLESAVTVVAQMLDDTSDLVRSNAAVSLEYIGKPSAIEALTKRLPKERDELVHNNLCRALGRCGAMLDAVRKTLLREFEVAKTNKLSFGPAIGLTYFVKDAVAARGIEKILAPGVDWQKRAFGLYALTFIGDPRSASFVETKILKSEKNREAMPFLEAVFSVLSGTDAKAAVKSGVESAISTIGDVGGPARLNRDPKAYVPNGEFAAPIGRGR